ncbi:MAG: tetraacyldisaccharide 4'-kinase, partial [Simkaniaceae bacterium]|nr:tetraacyldisaccharide 4'-kinase [Simkaniaceae bacterium]
MQAVESYIIDIIEGRRSQKIFKAILYQISRVFYLGILFKNKLYDLKYKKSFHAQIPVLSIGNIVAGGTGKTEFIKHFAKELTSLCNVAVLSRGYRSSSRKGPTIVTPLCTPNMCGDEPYMIK